MKILMTGFEPFGGETINPAYEAVKRLPDEIKGAKIMKMEIPVVFDKAGDIVQQALNTEEPDIVICVGQAGGRKGVTPERIAVNLQEARIPDNEGNAPMDHPVREGGPAAYFTGLQVKAMVANLKAAGVESSLSYSAGTYVCNDLFYRVMDHIAQMAAANKKIRGGFIHVPFIPEQTKDKPDVPSLPLQDIVKALTVCIETELEKEGERTE